MNEPDSPEGSALTTGQIAAAGAGRADRADRADPGQHPRLAGQAEQSEQVAAPRHAAGASDFRAGDQPRAQLLADTELQGMLTQWKEIQAQFVDEPRKAVRDADALVAELMQRLAQMFASEREQLESRWAGGDDVSTEDLRLGLRRYRSFFERLLAA
jgi:hypothetical protein